ncbi:4'-phosphopantetheinyl transferase family protein [Henriciella litoralis]|uniref:4'-phosphopantetheinyl transferase family protein n=1 Tax=Henriciella litoralis TaxID=568102 RepID=UPI0009FC96F6|nr:4'-phosphopantetheinyl transferase superfamily protein [Henriciella litoralis]
MTQRPIWKLSDRTAPLRDFDPVDEFERARSARLKTDPLRQDFLHARHLARDLACEQLGISNVKLQSHDDAAPEIESYPSASISWSRSGPLAIAAFSDAGRVGVDIEKKAKRPVAAMLDMVANPGERACVLAAMNEDDLLARFYRLWCAKESVLKWRGVGLRGGAKSVLVPDVFLRGDADEDWPLDNETSVGLWFLPVGSDAVAVMAFSA